MSIVRKGTILRYIATHTEDAMTLGHLYVVLKDIPDWWKPRWIVTNDRGAPQQFPKQYFNVILEP